MSEAEFDLMLEAVQTACAVLLIGFMLMIVWNLARPEARRLP